MKPKSLVLLIVLALFSANAFARVEQTRRRPVTRGKYIPVSEYDPKRDASRDILDAVDEAQRSNRNVLLEVGGQWCSWCHTLDGFFAANPDLRQLRDQNFVTVKVNYSEENENKRVLARYPSISGYPHIFFLDARGKLLFSQDTGLLEKGPSYDLKKLTAALTKWGPKQ
jgi:thioredoxin-related protein